MDYSRVSKPRSLSDRESEHHVHRKLEGLAYQYSELLTGQLESQRTHYEQQLAMLRHESEARAAEHASFGMLMSKVRAVGITTSNSSSPTIGSDLKIELRTGFPPNSANL